MGDATLELISSAWLCSVTKTNSGLYENFQSPIQDDLICLEYIICVCVRWTLIINY